MPGLSSSGGMSGQSLAEWVRGGSYSINAAPTTARFQLKVSLPDQKMSEALCSEICRFSIAALESAVYGRVKRPAPKALAWPFISSYYAAYFAAHAICRIYGRSVSQIDATTANAVGSVAAAYLGGTPQVGSGLYSAVLDSASGDFIFTKMSGVGGSHELLWKLFLHLLGDLQEGLLGSSPSTSEVQEVSNFLDQLRDRLVLRGNNGGNWLSVVRNDVTYRHQQGLWFPYKISNREAGDISRRLAECLKVEVSWASPAGEGNDIGCASELSASIVALLFWHLKDLKVRNSARRHFVDAAVFPLLRRQLGEPERRLL